MSRTFKTRPISVRIADKRDTDISHKEHHDHVDRECDLPPDLKVAIGAEPTVCHYEYEYNGHGLHSCALCTDKEGRVRDRRRERRTVREQLRKELHDIPEED